MDILVNVVNQKLKIATNLKTFVEGTQEFIRFVFNLNNDWDGLKVFAQFAQNEEAYNLFLDDDNSVHLPPEIVAGECTLMLYGSNERTIATTNYLVLKIDENILISDASSVEITESLYNQLVGRLLELEESIGSGEGGNTVLSKANLYTDTKIADLINGAPSTLDTLSEIAQAMIDNENVVKALDDAIGSKASADDVNAHISNMSNPHNTTLSQLGITVSASEINNLSGVSGNVQNQLDSLNADDVGADPSGSAANALKDAKNYTDNQIKVFDETITNLSISGKTITYTKGNGNTGTLTTQDTNTTYDDATTSAAGLMSAEDKIKLNGIATGANAYTHPSEHPASMISGLSSVAKSGAYDDLSGQPTALKNPQALVINNVSYDGSSKIDITDQILALINTQLGIIENGSY